MQEKSHKELVFISIFSALTGFVILLVELYYANYLIFDHVGATIAFLDNVLAKEQVGHFFQQSFKVRTISIGFFGVLIFFPTVAEKNKKALTVLVRLIIFSLLFFTFTFLQKLPAPNYFGQVLNIVLSIIFAFAIIRNFMYLARYLTTINTSLKDNEENADGFPQTTDLIENAYSVNIRTKFHYLKKAHDGWINVINVFRASAVIGTPGSGKTYATLEEYIRQLILKGFSAVIYDYKDPALSRFAYHHLKESRNPATLVYISFRDLNRTKRSNPLKNITSSAEATDMANVILTSLNKQFTAKQGEFFVESAKVFVGLSIYFLGIIEHGRCQSLPHLMSFINRKPAQLFPCFKIISIFYPDMMALFSPFEQAYENDVIEQLQGQLASAQIGVGSISDRELAYVMTEDENPEFNADLDINSLTDPKIFCIGTNNPDKEITYGLAASVYLSRIAKVINKKGTPCLFAVDELPTVYINGLGNLIATGRSNLQAVCLGFQDYSQLIRDYGDKMAKSIINTIANVFAGSVKGETAKQLSDSFGEKKVMKKSKTISHEGNVTLNYNEQKEKRIPQDVIEELSQGDMVGRVADNFDERLKYKVFHATLIVDPKTKECRHEIPALRYWTPEEQFYITQKNLIDINNSISDILNKTNSLARDFDNLIHEFTYDMNEIDPKTKEKIPQNVCLEYFLEAPEDKDFHEHFFLWLEAMYLLIVNLSFLGLKNDILDFETKFNLLMREVYQNGEYSNFNVIQEYRRKLNVMTLEEVQIVNNAT
jgi:hypothetical protein